VPRRHADGLWDLDDEEHAQVARAAGRAARLLRGVGRGEPDARNRGGGLAERRSLHVHVVPRYRADELRVMWQAAPVDDAELARLRARVLARDR
jgi:diadenosine tetraphosphate (Ap4A) HIT family hydrolase